MRVLPKRRREAMYAIYAFCRIVDDIADDQQGDRTGRAKALDQWRADLDALYAGREAGQAAFLKESVEEFGLDKADFIAVIDGMATDVDRDVRWPTEAELDLYCDRVASAVGRLSVRVFGMDRQPGIELSHHLGRALQLTNILRDIDEDASIGRVYLPLEPIVQAGIELTTPEKVTADPRIDAVARGLAVQARRHFDAARMLLRSRPKGYLLAPRLMEAAYARILGQMEQVGWQAPRTRISVSKPALLFMALRLALIGR
jgi:phytoene synthase